MVRINLSYQTASDGAPALSSEQMTAFEVAASVWSKYLKDDVDVNVHIGMSNQLPEGVIGGALPGTLEQYKFNHFKNDLRRDRTSQDDITAHANLAERFSQHRIGGGDDDDGGTVTVSEGFKASANGVTLQKSDSLSVTTAQAKALGLNVNSTLDGVIWMSDLSNLDSNQDNDASNDISWAVGPNAPTGNGHQIDFLSVAMHELGHILGFVSGADKYDWQQEILDISALKNQGQLYVGHSRGGDDDDGGGTPIPHSQFSNFGHNTPATPLDLFRYAPESRGLGIDLSVGGNKYFSIDGGRTSLAEFATGQREELGGDGHQASHWKDSVLGIMMPTLSLNQRSAISMLDLRAFDVIGWDLAYSLLGADGIISEAELRQTLDLSNPQTISSLWQASADHIRQNQGSLISDRINDVNYLVDNNEVYNKKKNKNKKRNKKNAKWQELLEWIAGELGFSTVSVDTPQGHSGPSESQTSSIGDRVWHDANGNGIQDAGEKGLANVEVQLRTSDLGFISSVRTDANGYYSFNNLTPGNYRLDINEATLPAGSEFTKAYQGGNDDADSNVINSGGWMDITTLDAGEHDRSWDAGIILKNAAKEENLVKNGSFEQNSVANRSWGVQSSLEGWVQTLGSGIEVQKLVQIYDNAANGEAWLELDANHNVGIAQEIDTEPGKTYQLSFAYSPRPGISAESNQIAVYWNGVLVDTITAEGQGFSQSQWQTYTYDVNASNGDTTGLEFRAVGKSDGLGSFLDNVKVIDKRFTSVKSIQNQNLATTHSFQQGLDLDLATGTLNFDGVDDYSQLNGLETGGSMTFAAWVNYDQFNHWSRIFDFGDGAVNNNIILGNKAGTNALGLHIYEGNQNVGRLEINDFWQADTWTHVTASIDESGKIQVYKNGVLAGEATSSVAPTEKVRTGNYIGKSHWSQDGAFDGQIDDVFVSNEVLNPQTIRSLYDESRTEHLLSPTLSPNREILDLRNGTNANLVTGILDFDGTDDHALLQGVETGDAMTFSAWVNYDSFNHWSRIFDFGDGAANNNILLGNRAGSNALGLHIFNGSQNSGILEIENFWQADTWTHVTASIDGSGKIQVYKNGVLAGEATSSVVPKKVRTKNYIGKSHWSQDGAFDGQLSNISLLGQSSNAAEAQALYKDAVVNLESQQQGDNILNKTDSLTLGRGEKDTLVGSGAADTFIVGDRTQAYYLGNGEQDYARIQGFNSAQDRIQLHGSSNQYHQLQMGDDLFLFAQETTLDLVAVLDNTAKLNLSTSAIFV
ncbi:MAG: NF038122 family metalloprotease [Cyanobacteria bacterium P01_F01_bin.150]